MRTACLVLALLVLPGIAVAGDAGAGAATPGPADTPPSAERPVGPADVGFDEILFVKRKPYSSDHYYTDLNNGTSPDRFLPGNGISIFDLRTRRERPVVRAADMPGGKGFIGAIGLSFDAKKVLFDFRQDPGSGFRIWEVETTGAGLRQVSFPPPDEAEKAARWFPGWHTDDIHPCYLPDGGIIFSSTRCEHTVLCGGSSHLVAPGLHRMDADGTHVLQLSNSPVSEFCPVILDDGRVMYHRWEYIDKGARVAKAVWSMNPDGSGIQELYGLSDDDTTVYMYPRPMPGSGPRFVSVGTCHFPQGGCFGSIMVVDYGRGVRVRGPDPGQPGFRRGLDQAVANITPDVYVERHTEPGWHFLGEDGRYAYDPEGRKGHLYTHPYPVSDREFMVSYKVKPSDHYREVPNAYALYLIDTEGRRRSIHADPDLSCWHPLPLVARPVPPVLRPIRDPGYAAADEAVCVLVDIERGMDGIEPGTVKWIRVNEALPRYWSTGRRWDPSLSSSAWKAALWPRVQWGVVPVEKDGSAHFVVPARRAIFYQALDENFRELQRERTYVNYAPGEVRSCAGCHGRGSRAAPPCASPAPLALTRPPSRPGPQPCDLAENGGDGRAGQVIHYPTDIQPIWNAKCVRCHGAKDPAGGLKLTDEITLYYNASYEALATKELAGPIIPEFTSFNQGDRGNYNGAYLPPRSLGCAKSTLIAVLTDPAHPKNSKEDHSKMLTEMEAMVVSRWVDTNYQFYGTYFGRQHPQWVNPDPKVPAYSPADFRREATFEEAIGFLAPPWHR
jgi:hypothetical protein